MRTGQACVQRLGVLVEQSGEEAEPDPAVLVTLLGGGEQSWWDAPNSTHDLDSSHQGDVHLREFVTREASHWGVVHR